VPVDPSATTPKVLSSFDEIKLRLFKWGPARVHILFFDACMRACGQLTVAVKITRSVGFTLMSSLIFCTQMQTYIGIYACAVTLKRLESSQLVIQVSVKAAYVLKKTNLHSRNFFNFQGRNIRTVYESMLYLGRSCTTIRSLRKRMSVL
jgi:hypothetical protein